MLIPECIKYSFYDVDKQAMNHVNNENIKLANLREQSSKRFIY